MIIPESAKIMMTEPLENRMNFTRYLMQSVYGESSWKRVTGYAFVLACLMTVFGLSPPQNASNLFIMIIGTMGWLIMVLIFAYLSAVSFLEALFRYLQQKTSKTS